MKKHDFRNEWAITQRVTIAVLNIMLTILYMRCEWSKEGCKQFEEEYTVMCRNARAKNKYTLAGLKDTYDRVSMDFHIDDLYDTVEDRLIQHLWRQCLMCGLTVLKQCNNSEALREVVTDFADYMSAIFNDPSTGVHDAVMTSTAQLETDEERRERQQAAVDLLNETMRDLGRSTGSVNEKVIIAMSQ